MSASLLWIAIVVVVVVVTTTIVTGKEKHNFVKGEGPAPKPADEVETHLNFYWHDITGGSNPTAIQVAQASSTQTSPTGFGSITTIDDPMTEGPEQSSRLVGRAQGLYVSTSQQELVMMMAMIFRFVDGKYNGSTVTVLGRNAVNSDVREMPIVGGTGVFRYARGYCEARTHKIEPSVATVEYNVYIRHY